MPPRRRRIAAIAAALALLALMVTLSRDFGATWDERFQQHYGERVWDYWHGRLHRADFEQAPGNEYLYGGLVEVVAVAAQHAIPADTYIVRHAVIAVFGWTGIVFAGLLGYRLYGARAGWLASLLLALSPRYFADSMNNPKDVPFAAASLAAVYFALTIRARPPYLTWKRAVLLALAFALAINIRPLGLMVLAFGSGVVCLTAFAAPLVRREGFDVRAFATTVLTLVAVVLVAIPAGTMSWPWAQEHPLVRPVQAFSLVSSLDWAQGFATLYQGKYTPANELPWHYVPVWLGISLPPVVLAGLAFTPVIAWRKDANRMALAALLAFALAPPVAAIVRHATLYDGIRHLTFIIPPLVVLSAVGWMAALDSLPGIPRRVVVALLAIGLAEPLLFQIRNYPNQAVYFSPLAGGPRAAFARYEMDYWGNSMLQAVKWAADAADRAGMPVVVTGNPVEIVQEDAGRFRSLATMPRRATNQHLDIRLMRGPAESLKEFAARPDIVYRVTTADGTPLCLILPGPWYGELRDRLEQAAARDSQAAALIRYSTRGEPKRHTPQRMAGSR